MRVGDVEAEAITFRQSRLPIGGVGKSKLIRLPPQVTPENDSEQSSSNNEVLTVFLEVKPHGPRLFVCREGLLQVLRVRRSCVQTSSPNMDLIAS